jgi:hypothetical protein
MSLVEQTCIEEEAVAQMLVLYRWLAGVRVAIAAT